MTIEGPDQSTRCSVNLALASATVGSGKPRSDEATVRLTTRVFLLASSLALQASAGEGPDVDRLIADSPVAIARVGEQKAPASTTQFRYLLIREERNAERLCRATRELMNTPGIQPTCDGIDVRPEACRLDEVDPKRFPDFALPHWEKLEIRLDLPELRALSDAAAIYGGRDRPPRSDGEPWLDWYWRTQTKPAVEVAIANNRMHVLRAHFDADRDGATDLVLRYDSRACINWGCRQHQMIVDEQTLGPRWEKWRSTAEATPIFFRTALYWATWSRSVYTDRDPEIREDAWGYLELFGPGPGGNPIHHLPVCRYAIVKVSPH